MQEGTRQIIDTVLKNDPSVTQERYAARPPLTIYQEWDNMMFMKPLHWLHGEVKTPPMSSAARKELEMKNIGKGWVEGSAQELLGLSDAEAAYVEAKVALTRAVRERRLSLGLSQASMAKALGTSQSRFSFIEKGDPSVSLDLTIRALFETGLDMRGVAAVMTGKAAPHQRTPAKPHEKEKQRRAAQTA